MTEKSNYPKFLEMILDKSDRNIVKEACCKMITQFFGKIEEEKIDLEERIQFIKIVEPLVKIIKVPRENGPKLTSLALMALINMCNFN